MEAVKVHRPQESASRGDDFDVKHRNTFCTFCRCHRDRARFDQVWVPATGLSSGLGRSDTIAVTGLGAWPRRNLNPVGLLLAHRQNPARTPLPFAPESGSICPVSYAYRMQSVGSLAIPLCWAEWRSSKNERAAS